MHCTAFIYNHDVQKIYMEHSLYQGRLFTNFNFQSMIILTIHTLKFWKNQFCFLPWLHCTCMYMAHMRHFQFWLRGTNDLYMYHSSYMCIRTGKKSPQHNCCRFLVICCELVLITILSQHSTTKVVLLTMVVFWLKSWVVAKGLCYQNRTIVNPLCNDCEIRCKLLLTTNID